LVACWGQERQCTIGVQIERARRCGFRRPSIERPPPVVTRLECGRRGQREILSPLEVVLEEWKLDAVPKELARARSEAQVSERVAGSTTPLPMRPGSEHDPVRGACALSVDRVVHEE